MFELAGEAPQVPGLPDLAIKILSTGFAQNEQFRARFEREAKTISSLNHPNICTLFDVGHEEGTHFLVMEMIEGETLADRLRKSRIQRKSAPQARAGPR